MVYLTRGDNESRATKILNTGSERLIFAGVGVGVVIESAECYDA